MIHVQNLMVSYSTGTRKTVLEDITLHIEDGEFVLVSGPSGCGKTTLALTLTGLIPQARKAHVLGRVMVDGLDTKTTPVWQLAGNIGIVFQNPDMQLFQSRVKEEVSFAPRTIGIDESEIIKRTELALSQTGILHLKNRLIRTLSSGEKQRVAIASVLSMQPKTLVLDEPTANLDWNGVDTVMQTLKWLNRELNMTIIIIEHRLSAVFGLAHRMVVLQEGRITGEFDSRKGGQKEQFTELGLRFPWRHVQGLERYIPQGIVHPDCGVEPLVSLKNLSAGYGRIRVVTNIDLSIYPGEFIALVGKNGAGKTTLARVIAGIIRPLTGSVQWKSTLKRLPAGRRVGIIFHNPSTQLLFDTVEDEIRFAAENFKLESGNHIQTILEMLDLTGFLHRFPVTLSLGEIQRLVTAAVLAADPELIILDEPTIGQDWSHLSSFMVFLQRLSQKGKAVLVITHDDKLVCRFAKRVIHIEDGRVAADGVPAHGRWSERTLEEAV